MNNTLLFIFVYDDNSLCLKSSCDTWNKSCQKCKDLMQPLQIPFYYNQLSTCNCCRKFVLDEIEYRGSLFEKIKKCLPWLFMFKIFVFYRRNRSSHHGVESHVWLLSGCLVAQNEIKTRAFCHTPAQLLVKI